MPKRQIIQALTNIVALAATLALLSVNWGVQTLCDEIPQVAQWQALCQRWIVALPVVVLVACMRPHSLPMVITYGIGIMTAAEGVCALAQIYGYVPSGNGLFRLSGSFYNPGPLGGYVALGIPLCIGIALDAKDQSPTKWLAFASGCIMLTVLPATMSRTAWLATFASSFYVLFSSQRGHSAWLLWRRLDFRAQWLWASISVLSGLALGVLMWLFKHDSAMGRFFIWRMAARAVASSPWVGHTSFEAAYTHAQENYFDTGGKAWEIRVADCPQYAFCDFLDIAVRFGLPIAVLLLVIVATAIVRGHKLHRHGLVGALLCLFVFSCGSYPMQIPAFVAVGVLLVVACTVENNRWRWTLLPLGLVVVMLCLQALPTLTAQKKAMIQWNRAKIFYDYKAYSQAIPIYESIANNMQWNATFLNEYGFALHKCNRHEEAIELLQEADKVGGNVMTLNTMGKCHQALGQYAKAEEMFRRSTHRLPNRLYPHHLLFMLYADSVMNDSTKRRLEAEVITTMPVKIPSPAVDEMRDMANDYLKRTTHTAIATANPR